MGRWRLDEGAGTSAVDTSGNNNNGTLLGGPSWAPEGFPTAEFPNPASLGFDGVDDQVVLGTNSLPANNQPQSIALWVNYVLPPPTTGVLRLQNFIALTNATALPISRLQVGFRTARIVVWKQDAMELLSAPAPTIGWHHVAYTFDGTTHRLYVDGTERDTSTIAPDTQPVTSARLGSFHKNEEFFRGALDEVRIYNRMLTPAEVGQLAGGKQ